MGLSDGQSALQIVPVFNDIEGDVQEDTYLLNSVGLLQDLHPPLAKNLRGYRLQSLLQTSLPWAPGPHQHAANPQGNLPCSRFLERSHRVHEQGGPACAMISNRDICLLDISFQISQRKMLSRQRKFVCMSKGLARPNSRLLEVLCVALILCSMQLAYVM